MEAADPRLNGKAKPAAGGDTAEGAPLRTEGPGAPVAVTMALALDAVPMQRVASDGGVADQGRGVELSDGGLSV